jgi:hypothetical protein
MASPTAAPMIPVLTAAMDSVNAVSIAQHLLDAEEQEEEEKEQQEEGPISTTIGPVNVALIAQPSSVVDEQEEEQEAVMDPVIAAVNEQPLVAAIVNEAQQEGGGETAEARRFIVLSGTDYREVVDASQFISKGQSMSGFHPSQWGWQRKTQTKVNPQVDKLFSNVRCYSDVSGNKFLLLTFGTETLRIILSSTDFNLLLEYKCIWFLLTDRWGLEPETGDFRAGQQQVAAAAAAVTTAVPQGTAVRTFAGQQGESVTEQQGAGVATLSGTRDFRAGQQQGAAVSTTAGPQEAAVTTAGPQGTAVRMFGKEPPAEIGDDETIICSKLVEMKGSSSQLVVNIGGRALTLVRSQLGQTDLLKKQIHYFIALELLAEPVIKIGEKDFRFTELFRYVVSSVVVFKRVAMVGVVSDEKRGPFRLLASFTNLETLEGETTSFILCLLLTTMCANPRQDCLVFNTITKMCELWTDDVTIRKYQSNVIKPIVAYQSVCAEMVHFLNNTRQFYDRSRGLPVWYEDPRAANPPVYQMKQTEDAEDKWFLQNNRMQSARLREKRSPSSIGTVESIDLTSDGRAEVVGRKRVASEVVSSNKKSKKQQQPAAQNQKPAVPAKKTARAAVATQVVVAASHKSFKTKTPATAVVPTQVVVAASRTTSSDSALMTEVQALKEQLRQQAVNQDQQAAQHDRLMNHMIAQSASNQQPLQNGVDMAVFQLVISTMEKAHANTTSLGCAFAGTQTQAQAHQQVAAASTDNLEKMFQLAMRR